MKKYVLVLAAFLACSSAFAQSSKNQMIESELLKAHRTAWIEAQAAARAGAQGAARTAAEDSGVCLVGENEADCSLDVSKFHEQVSNKLKTTHPYAEEIEFLGTIGYEKPGNGQENTQWYYYMMYESKTTIFQVVRVKFNSDASSLNKIELLPTETVFPKKISVKNVWKGMENLRRDLLRCDVNEFGVRLCNKGSLYDHLYLLAEKAALPFVDKIQSVQREKLEGAEGVAKIETYTMRVSGKDAEFSLTFLMNGEVKASLEYISK